METFFNMTEKEQLLPCPFCGGDDAEIRHRTFWTGMRSETLSFDLMHFCKDGNPHESKIYLKAKTREEVINQWNTRAISADEKEQLIRLKAFVNDVFDEDGDYITEHPREKAIKHGILVNECDYVIKADWLKDENDQTQHKLIMQEAEKALNTPPCMECGAATKEEAEKLCKCGGDRDHCHGCDLWPDD